MNANTAAAARNTAATLLRIDGRTDVRHSIKIRTAQDLANLTGRHGDYGQTLRVARSIARGAVFGA